MEFATIIKKNLRRILFERDMNAAELARRMKVPQSTVSTWINGKGIPSGTKIEAICDALDIRPEDLLSGASYSNEDPVLQTIMSSYARLNDSGREQLLKFIKYLESDESNIVKKGDQISPRENVS